MTAHTPATMGPPTAGAGGPDLPPLIRMARWPLLAASLLLAIASWLTTPLDASFGALTRDLAEGRVAEVMLGCDEGEEESGFRLHIGTPLADEWADVCWRNESGLSYAANVPETESRQGSRRASGRVSQNAAILAVIESADPTLIEDGTMWTATVHNVTSLLAFAVFVVLLVCLLVGPQPRRLTKWGTFSLLLMPAGLGPAWLLLREAPWDRNLHQLPEPPPRWHGDVGGGIRRQSGWTGFALLLIVTLLVSGASELVRDQLAQLDAPTAVGG